MGDLGNKELEAVHPAGQIAGIVLPNNYYSTLSGIPIKVVTGCWQDSLHNIPKIPFFWIFYEKISLHLEKKDT